MAKGFEQVRNNLIQLQKDYRQAIARAIYKFGQIEMREMKARTPVDTGTLRDSGFVESPQWNGERVLVTLGFGGAAEAYAVYVHEDLDAFHEHGQAKFMESVLNESEPHFAERIAADVKADLGL